jgi:hypothetical protein
MMKKIGLRLSAAILLVLPLWSFPEAARAAEGFFPDGNPPTELEVRQWSTRVKEFRETLVDGETGRFAAVRVDDSSVLLLDTRLGHLWVWTFGEEGSFTTYQGQLLPGLNLGDVVGVSPGLLNDRNMEKEE